MTSRRAFLCAALALASARAAAQERAKVRRIGFLDPVSYGAHSANVEQFRKGLSELGYSDGNNLHIEYLSAEGRRERLAPLAGDLVRSDVELIVTSGTPATLAAKTAAAGRIPVVTAMIVDPVETQLIESFEQPGWNVTGMAVVVAELEARRIELLQALAPGRTHLAVIMDMGNPAFVSAWKAIEPAAHAQGLEATLFDVRKPEDMPRSFAAAAARGADAALVRFGALSPAGRRSVVDLAEKHKLPAIYASRQFVDVGGLASYGVNTPQLYYRAAAFVDKILKGAQTTALRMERPSRFELVLNRRAARALGLIIPPDLLLKSDQVVG
jgi:putative ABC transport system substrate-binding protein